MGQRKDVWRWDGSTADLSAVRGVADVLDLEVEPRAARWIVGEFAPGYSSVFHRTDTIDFDVVLDGEIELVLTGESVMLGAGDCVVMRAADHAWRTGDRPALVSFSIMGIEPGTREPGERQAARSAVSD